MEESPVYNEQPPKQTWPFLIATISCTALVLLAIIGALSYVSYQASIKSNFRDRLIERHGGVVAGSLYPQIEHLAALYKEEPQSVYQELVRGNAFWEGEVPLLQYTESLRQIADVMDDPETSFAAFVDGFNVVIYSEGQDVDVPAKKVLQWKEVGTEKGRTSTSWTYSLTQTAEASRLRVQFKGFTGQAHFSGQLFDNSNGNYLGKFAEFHYDGTDVVELPPSLRKIRMDLTVRSGEYMITIDELR